MKHVPSAWTDLALEKTRQIAEIRIHTDINDGQLSLVQSCQDIDRSPFLQEIKHHLPSDFLGIGTDSFSYNAVICGKHIGSFVQRPARVAVPDSNESRGNVLEPAKTAQWFRQIIQVCARLFQPFRIGR